MPGSIKDRVAIVGMGCTQFGELWGKGPSDLIVEAVNEALRRCRYRDQGYSGCLGGYPFQRQWRPDLSAKP